MAGIPYRVRHEPKSAFSIPRPSRETPPVGQPWLAVRSAVPCPTSGRSFRFSGESLGVAFEPAELLEFVGDLAVEGEPGGEIEEHVADAMWSASRSARAVASPSANGSGYPVVKLYPRPRWSSSGNS